MKRKVTLSILLIVGILVIAIRPFVNISIKNETISKEQWKEDIEYLRKNLPNKHKDLFFKITEQEFNNSIDDLENDLGNIDSQEVQVRLMDIVSDIGDSHTNIVNFDSKYKYPIDAFWFKEGLFVTGVSSKYESALGCKITEINNIPIDKIINDVNTLIPHENEFLLKWKNPLMLQEPKVLKHFGIINKASEDENIVVTLEDQDNKVFKINILPELDHDIKWCNLEDKVKNKSLYSSSNEDFYLKYSENDNLIYCRFNNTSHPDAKELTLFKNMLEEKAKPKLIIDIRDNTGGMYTGNSPIVNMIRDSAYYNTKGNLFVIVGRKTFSSGLQYAFEFKDKTNAIFYGEPTGGKPDHYGNIQTLTLPNSKLAITYSTKHFQYGKGDAFVPDHMIEYSIKDFLAGVDPAIEKIKFQK